eukprot:TRINITY_DN5925_c0_g2_i8.p1 TRINITY_DN5925_c0_g2~~TRINITY_DN5925_c0_g2_i8.p1  ORF type:complete len:376 (+),score=36.41 TRINITY_DN5925_c0_g2_i8:64-1191(+)
MCIRDSLLTDPLPHLRETISRPESLPDLNDMETSFRLEEPITQMKRYHSSMPLTSQYNAEIPASSNYLRFPTIPLMPSISEEHAARTRTATPPLTPPPTPVPTTVIQRPAPAPTMSFSKIDRDIRPQGSHPLRLDDSAPSSSVTSPAAKIVLKNPFSSQRDIDDEVAPRREDKSPPEYHPLPVIHKKPESHSFKISLGNLNRPDLQRTESSGHDLPHTEMVRADSQRSDNSRRDFSRADNHRSDFHHHKPEAHRPEIPRADLQRPELYPSRMSSAGPPRIELSHSDSYQQRKEPRKIEVQIPEKLGPESRKEEPMASWSHQIHDEQMKVMHPPQQLKREEESVSQLPPKHEEDYGPIDPSVSERGNIDQERNLSK